MVIPEYVVPDKAMYLNYSKLFRFPITTRIALEYIAKLGMWGFLISSQELRLLVHGVDIIFKCIC